MIIRFISEDYWNLLLTDNENQPLRTTPKCNYSKNKEKLPKSPKLQITPSHLLWSRETQIKL